VDRNPDPSASAMPTLVLVIAGVLLGAVVIDLALVSWLIGEVRVLGMVGGGVIGALAARQISLERRVRRLESSGQAAAGQEHRIARAPAMPGETVRPAEQPVDTAPQAVDEPAPSRAAAREPAASASPGLAQRLFDWFGSGNVPVKIGLLVLLIGVAALLRYATEQGWLSAPIELRLAAVAATALAALLFAWRERKRRRVFAVSLQGGAIGVLALTVFAALRLYQVVPAGAAFALLVILVATAGVLAVAQRAQALAVLALITGLAAPILVSSGSGNHVVLFAWYAVLNLAMLAIAWQRDWPLLYRLGFAFTFLIGTAWGVLRYRPDQFASTQFFLTLFFLLYFLIPVLVENRRPEGQRNRIDAVLVFGLPLFWLPLQAGLLDGRNAVIAAASLSAAALYLASAHWLLRRRQIRRLGRAHAFLAVALATVAMPFAFSESTVVMIWALEGAALVWYGIDDRSRLSRLAGLALISLAMAIWLLGHVVISGHDDGVLLLNAVFIGGMALTAAALVSAWRLHDAGASTWLVNLLAAAALLPWTLAALIEIDRHVPAGLEVDSFLLWLGLTAALTAGAHRARAWPVTALACVTTLAAGVFAALQQTALSGWPLAGYGTPAWLTFIVLAWLARRQLRTALPGWQALAALGIQASLVVMLASVLVYLVDTRLALAVGWHWLAAGLPLLLLIAWLQADGTPLPGPPLPAGDERRWPLTAAVAAATLGLLASLASAGQARPLPFVPLLNPLELTQAAALVLLLRNAGPPRARPASVWLPWVGALAALSVTLMALRAVHHLADVAWSQSAMLASQTAQATLTVTWTTLGVIAWISGSRREQRGLWLAGALILGGVLLKLILIDRSYLSNVAGIVSFLGFGLLSVLVGYLAPAPPRSTVDSSARRAGP